MKNVILSILMLVLSANVSAEGFLDGMVYDVRLGYNIGGTAPIGMPAEIRKLNSYTLQPNVQIGVDAQKRIDSQWGVMLSLLFENKGMKEDARVKNYHTAIVKGGQHLEGRFTGDVTTKVTEWMFTIPVQATYNFGENIRLKFGPYASVLVSKSFTGYAHNGYLRVGNPTGAKVNIGEKEGERGDYDFSDDMRRLQWGVALGCDWLLTNKFGVYLDLSWGLNGVHHSNFKVMDDTLYPIFGTVGITYRIK